MEQGLEPLAQHFVAGIDHHERLRVAWLTILRTAATSRRLTTTDLPGLGDLAGLRVSSAQTSDGAGDQEDGDDDQAKR